MNSLEKKELKDMIYNYKSWLSLILGIISPTLLHLRKVEPFPYIYISVIIMCLCQYIYDSYLTDTKNKGNIFIYNIGVSSTKILFTKILVVLVFEIIMLLLNLPYTIKYINFVDYFWIFPLTATCVTFMYFTAMFSQSSETTSVILTFIVIFAYTFLLWNMDFIILKIGISLASAILMSFIAIKTADSLIYRQQL